MLFNSSIFLTEFLPVTLVGFFLLGRLGLTRLAVNWLTLSSLFFYGWWNPAYIPLLLASMIANFAIGRVLSRHRWKWLLVAGVVANLALLGYYKYAGFLVSTFDGFLGTGFPVPDILLPLAISFFTFQQIAYLSDAYDGVAEEPSLANYCMFISFFPHLIAGPITHHKEMIPQFSDPRIFRPQPQLLALGATVFIVGLLKKVMLADTAALWAVPVFSASDTGTAITALEAWGGAVAYTLQIYFDFSGYTDMAIGLGLLFGIRLPQNFDSPYKAHNIIEFWSRWHMTLTRFLTAYIYNPIALALNRRRAAAGKPGLRRGKTTAGAFATLLATPTIFTMFLAGLWHGAGWQFIVFGVLHGVYLAINHGWRTLKARWKWQADSDNGALRGASVLLTFICVLVGLVFFRSQDVPSALRLLGDMVGAHGLFVPYRSLADSTLAQAVATMFHTRALPFPTLDLFTANLAEFLTLLFSIVWLLPNTQQWLRAYDTGLGSVRGPVWLQRMFPVTGFILEWQPTLIYATLVGALGFLAVTRALSAAPAEFLYFKF